MMNREEIRDRPLQGEADFWRIRALLVATYPHAPAGFNWEVRRWEGTWFYAPAPGWDPGWERAVQVWETEAGKIVGAVHPDSPGMAVLALDPAYRDRLEETMIASAEEALAVPVAGEEGKQRLGLYVFEHDARRQQLLAARGYRKLRAGGVTRRLRFERDRLPPRQPLATGYTLRATQPGDEGDAAGIATLLNAAFQRDFHNAAEYLTFSRLAPSFRRELDLVAVAPDGTLAAYVGIPYVAEIGHGIFEPVCTDPDHRRHGLARALMVEGLYRLRELGAADVVVETGEMVAANRLYDSLGFAERYQGYVWERVLMR
jgi:GNAT superfamily N-acetyltransferase